MTTRTEIDAQNLNVDHRVLAVIDEVRSTYHACTLRHVASVMRVSPTAVRNRLQRMRDQGFVDWNDVPGSLRLTPTGMARIGVTPSITTVDDAPVSVSESASGGSTPGIAAVVAVAVAHAVQEALDALGITAGTTAIADQAAAEDHADPTSPEGSPAGTPDTAD